MPQNIRVYLGAVSKNCVTVQVVTDAVGVASALIRRKFSSTPVLDVALQTVKPEANIIERELKASHIRVLRAKITGLIEDTAYEIDVTLGSFKKTVSCRTLPSKLTKAGFSFTAATCYYDGFSRQQSYQDTLRQAKQSDGFGTKPLFHVLAGDNLYVDVAKGQRFDDSDGPKETVKHYVNYFFRSQYSEALSELPLITTWDDHEFWNNFPEKQFHLRRTRNANRRSYRDAGLQCLDLFQAGLNPPPILEGSRSYKFDVAGISFFVLDARTKRLRWKENRQQMVSLEDLEEFEDWCKERLKPGVLILGQPLWIENGGKSDYNPPDFDAQNRRIWRALVNAPSDVLVMSGDVHFSRLVTIQSDRGRKIHELVTSPACHIPKEWTIGLGSYKEQDQGTVQAPLALKSSGWGDHRIYHKLGEYHFGTDCQNTIAIVSLKPTSAISLSLSVSFVDIAAPGFRVAPSKQMELTGSDGKGGNAFGSLSPRSIICRGHHVISLKSKDRLL